MKIAIDGMGGDQAPDTVVDGVVQAARELPHELVLVGIKSQLQEALAKHTRYPTERISIVQASEIVGMREPPAVSVRKKRDSSINVAVGLARQNDVQALVSGGNTGAAVCAATLGLRLLPGVERPGIGVQFPTLTGSTLLIDAGANINPRASHLLQYALMGVAYMRGINQIDLPRIGLLNIGEEETKGTEFMLDVHKLLGQSGLSFLGNVEGHDLFNGTCDVIVCDGFVGNVTLKVSESLASTIQQLLRRQLGRGLQNRLGAFLSREAFRALRREVDYQEYGGAPLLGIDGICIICHGSSSPKSIKNAIRLAGELDAGAVNRHITEDIQRLGTLDD